MKIVNERVSEVLRNERKPKDDDTTSIDVVLTDVKPVMIERTHHETGESLGKQKKFKLEFFDNGVKNVKWVWESQVVKGVVLEIGSMVRLNGKIAEGKYSDGAAGTFFNVWNVSPAEGKVQMQLRIAAEQNVSLTLS